MSVLYYNIRVVAIDLPGYGDSDKPKDADFYRIDNMVDLFPEIIHGLGTF